MNLEYVRLQLVRPFADKATVAFLQGRRVLAPGHVIPLSKAPVSDTEEWAEAASLSQTAYSKHDDLNQASSGSEVGDLKSNSFGHALFLAGSIALVFGAAVLLPIALFTMLFFFQLLVAVAFASGAVLIFAGAYLLPNDISG